jgi:hypothetical protein
MATETNREKRERAKKKGNLSRFSEDHQKRKEKKEKPTILLSAENV